MPTTTPLIKVNRTKSYGAEVVLYGDVYDEACKKAYELAEKEGYTFIHPFDDLSVATGQGTIAMEIFKELPLVEYILVPIGGGGLAAGVATLAKLLNPKIKVIGVEPAGANCMQASIASGKVATLPLVNTIADGTAVKTPGSLIFPYIQEHLDDIITVEDEELVVAFLDMVDRLGELRVLSTQQKRRDAILQMACKKAIKGGDRLTMEEIKPLLMDMIRTNAPPTCPHGRPLVITLSRNELEKRFRRIND